MISASTAFVQRCRAWTGSGVASENRPGVRRYGKGKPNVIRTILTNREDGVPTLKPRGRMNAWAQQTAGALRDAVEDANAADEEAFSAPLEKRESDFRIARKSNG